jgi:hypothetical protein
MSQRLKSSFEIWKLMLKLKNNFDGEEHLILQDDFVSFFLKSNMICFDFVFKSLQKS